MNYLYHLENYIFIPSQEFKLNNKKIIKAVNIFIQNYDYNSIEFNKIYDEIITEFINKYDNNKYNILNLTNIISLIKNKCIKTLFKINYSNLMYFCCINTFEIICKISYIVIYKLFNIIIKKNLPYNEIKFDNSINDNYYIPNYLIYLLKNNLIDVKKLNLSKYKYSQFSIQFDIFNNILKYNTTLTVLNLNYLTCINSTFWDSLKYNNTLLKLYVSHITWIDTTNIDKMLKCNNTLQTLHIYKNEYFYNIGFSYPLIKGLRNNKTLTNLSIDIETKTFIPLCKALENNKNLHQLKINVDNILSTITCDISSLLDLINTKPLEYFYITPIFSLKNSLLIYRLLQNNKTIKKIDCLINKIDIPINKLNYSFKKKKLFLNYDLTYDNFYNIFGNFIQYNKNITNLNLVFSEYTYFKQIIDSSYILTTSLKNNNYITKLELNFRELSKDIFNLNKYFDFYDFYSFLKDNTTLTKLIIKNSINTSINNKKLFKNLISNTTLTKLIVDNDFNYFDNKCIINLNKLLTYNTTLTSLSLKYGQIENYDKLFETLKFNTSLCKLNLHYTNIRNIDKLAETLQFNSTLIKLSLKHNKIFNIDILSEVIRYNTTI